MFNLSRHSLIGRKFDYQEPAVWLDGKNSSSYTLGESNNINSLHNLGYIGGDFERIVASTQYANYSNQRYVFNTKNVVYALSESFTCKDVVLVFTITTLTTFICPINESPPVTSGAFNADENIIAGYTPTDVLVGYGSYIEFNGDSGNTTPQLQSYICRVTRSEAQKPVTGIEIGCDRRQSGKYFPGNIMELLVYEEEIGSNFWTRLRGHLKSKWNINF